MFVKSNFNIEFMKKNNKIDAIKKRIFENIKDEVVQENLSNYYILLSREAFKFLEICQLYNSVGNPILTIKKDDFTNETTIKYMGIICKLDPIELDAGDFILCEVLNKKVFKPSSICS